MAYPLNIPYNELSIIQTALVLLGYPLIQSVDAGGPAAAAADNVFGPLLAADLSSPNWRFATKVQVLSQIAAVDPDFMYYHTEYQLPPDCLAVWSIFPPVPYEIFGQQLWTYGTGGPTPAPTNGQKLQIQYRSSMTPISMLPPAYIMYFCYLLAVTIAPGITDDPSLAQALEATMTKWRSQAMVVNTQGRPNQGLTNSTWINSRPSGSFYGTSRSST
ncbi:hypothetical protein UFOVP23_37 [uncultured Caudovirales phage]|uniref:Uncharacterized protein n=1 Tax=uncultured Caudovirales phage TaxID=2100421 RepID=A0A6J5T7Z9_9CAUD|nr:hypothetical protein UFOVP23_37 [uncultured Caudovirales phage]